MSDTTPNPEQNPVDPAQPDTPSQPDVTAPAAPAAPSQPGTGYPSAPAYPAPGQAAPAFPGAQQPGMQQPTPPVQQTPGAPYAAPAVQPNFTQPSEKKGLAVTGMILGIAGLVFCWVPFFGVLLALVGLVISIIAMVKKQPIGFTLTGVITGALGLIAGAIVTVITVATFAFIAQSGVDIMDLSNDMIAQCEAGAETIEVFGETVQCSTILP